MFLRSTTIPDIYRLITETPSDLRKLRGAELSLTAALFLALAHRHAQDTGATNLAQSILGLNLPGVAPATHCLQSASTQKSADPFGAPAFDLYRIASKADLLSHEWPRPLSPISNDRRLPSGGRSIRSPSYLTMPVALTAKLVLTPRSLT